MKKQLIAASVVFAMVPIPQAVAQTAALEPGMRVRLSASSGETFVGHIDRAESDSLWIHMETADGPLVSLERSRIWRAELSGGLKGNPGKGVLYGAGFGLGLGIVGALALDDDCLTGIDNFDICEGHEATVIAGSTLVGAAAGALVGLLVKSEQWMDIRAVSPIVRAERDGMSLGLLVRL